MKKYSVSITAKKKKPSKKPSKSGLPLVKVWPIDSNFQYAVEYEIHDEYGEDHDSFCDPICRCREITSVDIREVSVPSMVHTILNQKPKSIDIPKAVMPFFKYALDRIVTHSGALKTDSWEAEWGGGYYGEEVHAVNLDGTVLTHIQNFVNRLIDDPTLTTTIQQCVLVALEAEYGYVLEGLDGFSWTIESIPLNDIIFPPLASYTRTDQPTIARYSTTRFMQENKDFPAAVVVQDIGSHPKYRLIDGRHRILASKNLNRKKVRVIAGHLV